MSAWIIMLAGGPVVHFAPATAHAMEELILLNWGEYMDPGLLQKFQDRFNVRVKEVYYESDELKDELLVRSNGKGYDMVISSGVATLPYLKRNWLCPLPPKDIPNLKHIDDKFLTAYPELNGYVVPYTWGFTGIAYRKDLIKKPITSWNQLFRPTPDLRGKILMIRDSKDTVGPALKALGYSLNSDQFAHYDAAEQLLLAQKPFVREFRYMALTSESAIVKGDVWMAPIYNGDAVALQEILPDIELAIPVEGVSLWIDYIMILNASQKKKLAMEFINFINEPKNAARLSEFLYFASPNRGADKYLTSDHLNNPMIYLPKETLAKSEFERPVHPRIDRKRNAIFSKLIH